MPQRHEICVDPEVAELGVGHGGDKLGSRPKVQQVDVQLLGESNLDITIE